MTTNLFLLTGLMLLAGLAASIGGLLLLLPYSILLFEQLPRASIRQGKYPIHPSIARHDKQTLGAIIL